MARQAEICYVNFYSAGSEAVKFDPKPVKKAGVKLPKPRRKKRIIIHVDPVACIGILVAMVLMISMAVGLVHLKVSQKEAAQMQSYVSSLQQENKELTDTYKSGYDLEEIRKIAIARGMIPANQAQQIHVQTVIPQEAAEPTLWENLITFLAGLFA